jgi:hypothetical protein
MSAIPMYEPDFTCDAGECDIETMAVVLVAGRWLSMCRIHAELALIENCCGWHNHNCEPPSELCCQNCTEAHHGWHQCEGFLKPSHHFGEQCVEVLG